jgi:hypothetical protein
MYSNVSLHALTILLIVAFLMETVNGQVVSCSTFENCSYPGCVQEPYDSYAYGCFGVEHQARIQTQNQWRVTTLLNYPFTSMKYNWCVYKTYDMNGDRFYYCPAKPCNTSCPYGQYLDSCLCLKCPAGSYCNNTISIGGICPVGTYSDAGGSECTTCNEGSYRTAFGLTSSEECKLCDIGKYFTGSGATIPGPVIANRFCSDCPKDATCDRVSATCVPGTFNSMPNFTNEAFCQNCPAGSYSSALGARSCTRCSNGAYTISDRSTSETACIVC